MYPEGARIAGALGAPGRERGTATLPGLTSTGESPPPAGPEPVECVTAVVVTFRRPQLLAELLDALRAQTRPPDRVLIVDNGGDVDPAVAPPGGPTAILPMEQNAGPAGGYAAGFAAALESGATKLWAVDDDNRPEPRCLERLLAAAGSDDAVFPLQRKPSGFEGFPPSWNGPLIDAGAVARAGLPRAEMFFWAEDTEFFLRCRNAGVTIRHCPDAVVFHAKPALRVAGRARDWRLYYEVRNTIWLRTRARRPGPVQLWRVARVLTGKLYRIVAAEPGKAQSLRLFGLGVVDGVRGRMGRRVDPAAFPSRDRPADAP